MPFTFGGADGITVGKYCQEISFGDYSMNEVSTIRYSAFRAHYAGFLDVQKVSMTFLKPVPDVVTPFFHGWRDKIVDQDGFYYPKLNYIKTISVHFFDNDGTENGNVVLRNAFPNVFPGYQLGYEQTGMVRLTIEFQIDRIIFS